MGISKWLDLMMLAIVLAMAVPMMIFTLLECEKPIMQPISDKTVIETENAIYVGNNMKTGADLLMSLVVLDDLTPYPKSIRINETPIIDINSAWVMNRSSNVAQVYTPVGDYKLGNLLTWKIVSIEYVHNAGDAYLHYNIK